MLKTRVITALIILPATLAVVFLTPAWLFRLAVAGLLLAGCWEFRRLADLAAAPGYLLMALQLLIFGVMILYWPLVAAQALPILAVACAAWLLMFTRLFRYRDGQSADHIHRRLGFLAALVATTGCFFALSWLRDRPDGPLLVFLPLLIIWASDVGAYFSGKYLGRRKLAPVISPKKTWEGVYGGALLAVAAAFLWSALIAKLGIPALALVVTTLATALASVGGDLFISIHKRTVGIDDTGSIFPGHGGVLDRYDSLLAGAPFFALVYGALGP